MQLHCAAHRPCLQSHHATKALLDHRLQQHWRTQALQRPEQQQQQQRPQYEDEQLDQQLTYRPPPGRRYTQLWKTKRPRRKPRLLDAPRDPRDPQWGTTRRQRKAALQQQLEEAYGPHAGDRDVRLYLKRRSLNEARPSGTRRGGFPLDDSFSQPGTFLKLSLDFQRTVLLERVDALVATLPRLSPESAWQLYSSVPGLMTRTTLQVAQHLTGLANATGLSLQATLDYCCSWRPLCFVPPDTLLSRVALLAKVARLEAAAAVVLMRQQPALWLMSSRLLAPRVEQLSLLLHCCPVTSLRLLGRCTQLLSAPLHTLQQQLAHLCSVMHCVGQPEKVVPLLLWQPALLLNGQQQQEEQEEQQQLEEEQQPAPTAAPGAPTSQHHYYQQQHHHEEQQQASGASRWLTVAGVGQQLQCLSTQLDLPLSNIQQAATAVPELLQLAAAGASPMAASVASLQDSWLLCPDAAAGQQRQQYQRKLLRLLQPQQHSKGMKRRKVGQGQAQAAVSGWYDAAQEHEGAVLRCQWWADAQQQQQHSAVQQLVLQAPALLVLAAAQQPAEPVAAAASASGALAARGAAGDGWRLQQGDGMTTRLQLLCQQLLLLLDDDKEQQQQQLDSSNVQQDIQQQQWHDEAQLLTALRQAAVFEPCLLTQPPRWVCTQLRQLARALQVPLHTMLDLWLQHPAVLWVTQGQVFEQVRVLSGVLKLPAQDVKRLLAGPDAVQLLLMHPAAVKKGFAAAAAAAQAADGKVRAVLRQQPAALLPGRQARLRALCKASS